MLRCVTTGVKGAARDQRGWTLLQAAWSPPLPLCSSHAEDKWHREQAINFFNWRLMECGCLACTSASILLRKIPPGGPFTVHILSLAPIGDSVLKIIEMNLASTMPRAQGPQRTGQFICLWICCFVLLFSNTRFHVVQTGLKLTV